MPEFDDARSALRAGRAEADTAAEDLAAARQRHARIAREEAELARVFDSRNYDHAARRQTLKAERASAEAAVAESRSAYQSASEASAQLSAAFAAFTDPRNGIERLTDAVPILLMPVRLETRFKTVAADNGTGRELWVRVYPDDCWIDTFEPSLSSSEVTNARSYWTVVWQAGGIEEQERGAWRALALVHGPGRARWIVDTYQPANLADKPVKALGRDVILTIVAEAPFSAAEVPPLVQFWRRTWLADGDLGETTAARNELAVAVGAPRADQLASTTVPANFSAPLAPGTTKQDVAVTASVVVLPTVETTDASWNRPPRARVLPDRFVFIGYDTGSDEDPLVVLGAPVPGDLVLAPDPSAPEEEQIRPDADGNLIVPDDLAWIADFERAVAVGMGMRVKLDTIQAQRGFARVLVVGLRINANELEAKAELETLLRHHALRRKGLAIVPQGTPTNNTEAVGSGKDRVADPDDSFDANAAPQFTAASDWLDKRDGQWLAELLGVDPALFSHTEAAAGRDQLCARAMHAALWPATLGYWMESMMAPVFDDTTVDATRDFFTRYVVGGGACPTIRIGDQPYGILPATAYSRMAWIFQQSEVGGRPATHVPAQDPTIAYLRRLYPLLLEVDRDFRAWQSGLSHVGAGGDPHAILLDIVGLHPGSVEWWRRYAESIQTLHNRANLGGFSDAIRFLIAAAARQAAVTKLADLGYSGEVSPRILDLVFSARQIHLNGGVVDDQPLSESAPVRPYTDGGDNYIQWLIDAAGQSLSALYQQQGFKEGKPPKALLYLLLRHALQLGYSDTGIRLHLAAGIFDAQSALRARSDQPFLHIQQDHVESESRYAPLFATQAAITGSATTTVQEYIGAQLFVLGAASYLQEQLAALERLKDRSTGELERAFADHVDCCTYRLDPWLLGIVNVQLTRMRNVRDGVNAPARQGVHLGAYAWLEDLRPENKVLTPVAFRDTELEAVFAGDPPLVRDSANQGYVHAPSLNHGVAAAVLRNGYLSNASPANRQTMAVNLTSERVRTALAMIEGIRAGQSLASLLGYQFERGLHDRHNLAEVDKFIYKLRKAFPLRSDHLTSTKTEEGVPIEAIEARNVLDGLALVEHMAATGSVTYPFGKAGLPAASPAEAAAINAEAERVRDAHDAVADLALAEGVYQAVLGNYDRVASTYDAYARGNFPPEPDVVRTPLNGLGITHRVALHLEVGVSPTASPVLGIGMTPRAQAEPAVNRWLGGVLPALDQVGCLATYRSAATGTTATIEVNLHQVGLQPADVVAIVGDDDRQLMAELDDRIVRHVTKHPTADPRPDVPVTIEYMKAPTHPLTVFQLMPLVQALRALTTRSRPLRTTDFVSTTDARSEQDIGRSVDKTRLDLVRAAMQVVRDDLDGFILQVDGPLSDLANRRGEILTDADSYIEDLADLLARAASFVVAQSGWGFAYDLRRRTFTGILDRVASVVTRWNARLVELDEKRAAAAAAPTDEEKFGLLAQAERLISTSLTTALPGTPAAYETLIVTVKLPLFVARRDALAAVATTSRRDVTLLLADVQALLPLDDFDSESLDLTPFGDELVRLAEDARSVARVVVADLDRRLVASQASLDEHDGAVTAAARVAALEQAAAALLGEGFRIFPEVELTPALGDELANAVAASTSGDLFDYLQNPVDPGRAPVDFPADEWLYGVARVREKMHAWEQVVMLAGALGRPEPDLVPLQLPFLPNDRWLGLEFPPDLNVNIDRLLYTAHFAVPFDKTRRQCGLLLDEWTETIPTQTIDTGITFHHDRPNSEAPQAMLLVTPAQFRGTWRWDDLLDALNETLDLAKRRAIEPRHLDNSPYGWLLPATVMATQVRQLTIAADLILNNVVASTGKV